MEYRSTAPQQSRLCRSTPGSPNSSTMSSAGQKAAAGAMSQRDKYDLIESEVRSFYEYCREAGISEEDMDAICRPLSHAVRRAAARRRSQAGLMLLAVMALAYTAYGSEWAAWQMAALARAALLRILPLWDWTPLYRRACLVQGGPPLDPSPNPGLLQYSDCITCEAVHYIDRISDTNYDEVFNHHLIRGAPVIVTDAHHDWASSRTELNLTSLVYQDDRLSDSVPCRILSNIRIGRQPMDLQEIITRITNINIPNWFVHFQNCDIRAVKSLRILAPRPYFLAPHIRPSHFNWLLMSNRYQSQRYKYLELDVGLIIMSQLKGKTNVHLKPRAPCEDDCPSLSVELLEGETLVLGNSLWEFEYSPDHSGENIAMITETDWEES